MAGPAKKSSLAESKARAKKYQESLKRKSEAAGSPSAISDEKPPSAKKPRKQPQSKAKEKTKPQEKADKIQESRRRAKEYRDKELNGVGDDQSDQSGNEDMDTSDSDVPSPVKPSQKRPAQSSPGSRSSVRRKPLSPLPPPPPMPETPPSSGRGPSTSTHRPSVEPPSNGNGGGNGSGSSNSSSNGSGGDVRPSSQSGRGRRTSFLKNAPSATKGNDAELGASSATTVDPGQPSTRRRSFLSYAGLQPSAPGAAGDAASGAASARVAKQQKGQMTMNATGTNGAQGERPSTGGARQGWAKVLAFKCTVALAPVVLFFLVSGVPLAWPYVQLSAGGLWGALRGFSATSPAREKCFLTPSEREANLAVCKPGVEVADCPEQATCALGKLLHCAMPFERHADGTACVLNAEAEEEVNAVVEALGLLTIEELCKGSGLIMPSPEASSRRTFITLRDAAAAQKRAPLSFLAGLPPGNVAGVIDLEGEASSEFGGGDDGTEGKAGSGSERVARLSASAYEAVMLTPNWRCKARLAAGSWFQAYWPYCLGIYALLLFIVYLDLKSMQEYKKHKQVCTMRDDCYRVLLGHAAKGKDKDNGKDKDTTPMQVSHIQVSVGDRWRTREGGRQANIQQQVRKLWPLVEAEVEHDTRIRRSFKYVMGQKNAAVWQWIDSAGTTFEEIGELDPGSAPRLWLRWWRS